MKHLMNSFKTSTIVQTNHSVIINLMKQKSIILTTFIMRMNVRLIKVS